MVEIPLDLQDYVMDNLTVQMLGPSCLVSRHWLARLRSRYFAGHTIPLHGKQLHQPRNDAFTQLLHAEYSTLPRYVQNVYLSGPEEQDFFLYDRRGIEREFGYIEGQYRHMKDKVLPELAHLLNVVHLSLSHIKWDRMDKQSLEMLLSIRTVKRLSFEHIAFPSAVEALNFSAGPFSHIQYLEFGGLYFNDLAEDVEWKFPLSLHEIHFTFPASDNPVITCMLNSQASIQVLGMKYIDSMGDVSKAARLLNHLSHTLTTISLDIAEYACGEGQIQPTFTLPISFEDTPNLQSLRIAIFPIYPFERCQNVWLMSMIRSIRSEVFASLTLDFWMMPKDLSSMSRAYMISFNFLPIEAALLEREQLPLLSLVFGQSGVWARAEMKTIEENVKDDLWRIERQNGLRISFSGCHEEDTNASI